MRSLVYLSLGLCLSIAVVQYGNAKDGTSSILSPEDQSRVFDGIFDSEIDRENLSKHAAAAAFCNVNRTFCRVASNGPSKVSLRNKMFPDKGYGQGLDRGTCTAFTAVTLAEFLLQEPLSEQCLARFSSHEDPGDISERVEWFLRNGLYRQDDCPYDPTNRDHIPYNLNTKSKVYVQAEIYKKILNWQEIVPFIKSHINHGLPVGVSSYTPGRWWFESYDKRPLMTPSDSEVQKWRRSNCTKEGDITTCEGHAYVITGYDDSTQTFEIKNSWGTNWKDSGYAKMSYAYLERFFSDNPFVALKSTVSFNNFSLNTGTALHETGDEFEFLMAKNRDLFAIKNSGTGSHSTEVHVLSAASGYKSFSLQTGTCLHETDGTFAFCLAPNNDLFAIKKSNAESHSSEVHVLSAATQYQQFSLQIESCLHDVGDNFQFCLAPNRDLFAIKKVDTGSDSTEIHVLSAAHQYKQFSVQTRSKLHETGSTYDFEVASNGDIIAIKKRSTGTNSTEVHVLENR